jgi:hypothetical protein
LSKVNDKQLTQVEASKLLKISSRHIRTLLRKMKLEGPQAISSQSRGKASNRAYSETYKRYVLGVIREFYYDFGPTLAQEKLSESHDIHIHRDTVRKWMSEAGIWKSRKERKLTVQQPRYRRECYGELIQIDGSYHRWFENRGPKCCLLVFVDDATSKLMDLHFCPVEDTFSYMFVTRRYVETYGRPIAFYSDKHSVFRVNHKSPQHTAGITQFGRALNDLNIDIICANSAAAKGRVERMNKTLQDRLVKELRLNDISSIKAGNRFLPKFIEKFNSKFEKVPQSPMNLHRELDEDANLDDAFAAQYTRTVTQQLTVQNDKIRYLLQPNADTIGLARKKVTFYDYADGRVGIKHNGKSLPFKMFDKLGSISQATIADNKLLAGVLQHIKSKQDASDSRGSQRSLSRRGQQQIAESFKEKNLALFR